MPSSAVRLKKALLVLSAVSALALPAAALAVHLQRPADVPPTGLARQLPFRHFSLTMYTHDCGVAWTSAAGSCYLGNGFTTGLGMVSGPTVSWCAVAAVEHCAIGHGHTAPKGDYSRWVKVCFNDCTHWFLGALAVPTGAFSVVAGSIGGAVQRDSGDQSKMESPKGPLSLVFVPAHTVTQPFTRHYSWGLAMGGYLLVW